MLGLRKAVGIEGEETVQDVANIKLTDLRVVNNGQGHSGITLTHGLAIRELVVSSHRGEVADNVIETEEQRVQPAGYDCVEVQASKEIHPLLGCDQFLVPEAQHVKESLASGVEGGMRSHCRR